MFIIEDKNKGIVQKHDMPATCYECPFFKSQSDGGIEFCYCKNPNHPKEPGHDYSYCNIRGDKDPECTLRDGQTVYVEFKLVL